MSIVTSGGGSILHEVQFFLSARKLTLTCTGCGMKATVWSSVGWVIDQACVEWVKRHGGCR